MNTLKDIAKRRAIYLMAMLDYMAAVVAWMLFIAYRYNTLGKSTFWGTWKLLLPRDYFYGFLLLPAGWLLLYLFSGTYFDLYRKSRLNEINRTLISCIIGSLILGIVVFADDAADYSYFIKISGRYLLIHTGCTLLLRMMLLNNIKRQLRRGVVGFNTLMIGANEKALETYNQIKAAPKSLGNDFKGYIYSSLGGKNVLDGTMPNLGNLEDLEQVIDQYTIEEVVVAVDTSEHHLLENILTRLSYRPVVVKVLPDLFDIISGSVKTSNVYDAVLMHIYPELMPGWQRVCKRGIDILCSSFALLLLSPLYILSALLVKLSSKGPVFYRQERIGLYGRPFNIFKFRSMFTDAEAAGPALSSKADPRITPWGRIMRKWRIDELPQFINILKGDMSLVGPRPERRHFIDIICRTHPHYKYLHKVKPGLTSWGMVQYGYAENVEEMISRMKYDLLYIENCSIMLDIKITLYTFVVLFQGRGK